MVPYVGRLAQPDARLIRLAEFLGVSCESIELRHGGRDWWQILQAVGRAEDSCLVIHPEVIERCLTSEAECGYLASLLVSEFRYLLVCAPRDKHFDARLLSALSEGAVDGVREVTAPGIGDIACMDTEICGPFAGLSISHPQTSFRTFGLRPTDANVSAAISVESGAGLAMMRRGKAQIVYVGGADLADLDEPVGDSPISQHFSGFLPYAMALRHIFSEESWRPGDEHFASVIVDDPLLRPTYGFLNFERLLDRMKQERFQTTIAFIPHNYRRNSRQIVDMFKQNSRYFSLCFHGNDHTGAELASTDTALLNTMLNIAEQRMRRHQEITGLSCDNVMVFPQGNFSVEAMEVLKARNFEAAVNTVSHPRHEDTRLTLAEVAQPAVLRYAGFPLFLRKPSADTVDAQIAFNLFFGRPTLIVEHHEIFQDVERLTSAVARINAIAPSMHWSSTGDAVTNSVLRRRGESGTHHIRAYSRTVRLSNPSAATKMYQVEWKDFEPGTAAVLKDGISCDFLLGKAGIRTELELAAHSQCTLSLVYENHNPKLSGLGVRRNVRAVVRRRLSEIRDNYISKNPSLATAAKQLRRHLVH
jgi:hypothetical protein